MSELRRGYLEQQLQLVQQRDAQAVLANQQHEAELEQLAAESANLTHARSDLTAQLDAAVGALDAQRASMADIDETRQLQQQRVAKLEVQAEQHAASANTASQDIERQQAHVSRLQQQVKQICAEREQCAASLAQLQQTHSRCAVDTEATPHGAHLLKEELYQVEVMQGYTNMKAQLRAHEAEHDERLRGLQTAVEQAHVGTQTTGSALVAAETEAASLRVSVDAHRASTSLFIHFLSFVF